MPPLRINKITRGETMLEFASKNHTACEAMRVDMDDLLFRIAAGEQAALAQLYEHTQASVFGFALSILKNTHDAEDVLHDCYVAVWQGAAGYRSRGKPLAWILTVTRNLCLQQLRTRSRVADLAPEDWEPYLADKESVTLEDRSILRSCMEQLRDEERQIVTLHALSGFKHREIAAILQLPLPTVLSKYHRAVKRLKQHLQ